MKVVDNNGREKVTFRSLVVGDIYIDGGQRYCMKIAPRTGHGSYCDSLVLETGYCYNETDEVVELVTKANFTILK